MEKEELSMIIDRINLGKFKEEYSKFRESSDYAKRKSQSRFVEVAQWVIKELLKKEKISNEDLTALIQMFGASCKQETFQKHLKNLKFEMGLEERIYNRFNELGECGYTGRGRAAIRKLSGNQLDSVKSFLLWVNESQTPDQVKTACTEFREKHIPEVGIGVYSPWLHYLKPNLCPIIAGEVRPFLIIIGWDRDYRTAMDFFYKLKSEISEDDLGLIDAYLLDKKQRDAILVPPEFPKESFLGMLLNNKKQIILYGPPGTGKTYKTKKIAMDLIKKGAF